MIVRIKQKFKCRSKRGDTLIEVIFALAIIGFIIMVAIQGALSANRAAADAQLRTQGQLYATSQIEAIRVYSNALFWSDNSIPGGSPNLINTELNNRFSMPVGVLAGSIFVCPSGPPPLQSSEFHAEIYPATNNIDLVLGSELFEGYTIKNVANLTKCSDYNNDSVQITTTVSWRNRSNVEEHVTLIDYLTLQSKDS